MVVGFSQSEQETNPFRSTESDSIRSAAKQNGVKLLYANAQSQEPKQISDIRDLLSRGADALIVAPLLGSGLQSAFTAADNANVPVILIDRQTAGTPCKDYITNIESNFIRQGQIAAQEIAKLTNNKAKIAVLQGTPGASVTNDRNKGFEDAIKGKPGMKIVASQTGNFVRADGQQVMEQIIQANPDINAVYAQNDEMAIGAITALKSAGKNPGQDVKIIGIDGTQDAAKAILTGDLNATVTTNPRFGPKAFEVLKDYLAGEKIPQNIRVKDELVTKSNAQQYLKNGAY
jgi:ribose transport system substrate-binding protein